MQMSVVKNTSQGFFHMSFAANVRKLFLKIENISTTTSTTWKSNGQKAVIKEKPPCLWPNLQRTYIFFSWLRRPPWHSPGRQRDLRHGGQIPFRLHYRRSVPVETHLLRAYRLHHRNWEVARHGGRKIICMTAVQEPGVFFRLLDLRVRNHIA